MAKWYTGTGLESSLIDKRSVIMDIAGHWKLLTSENWNEFLKATGVSFLLRMVGNATANYEELEVDGDDCEYWHIKQTNNFRSRVLQAKLGQEFEDVTLEGKKVKTTLVLHGDKLVQRQSVLSERQTDITVTRELLEDGRLMVTYFAENKGTPIVARHFYERLAPNI